MGLTEPILLEDGVFVSAAVTMYWTISSWPVVVSVQQRQTDACQCDSSSERGDGAGGRPVCRWSWPDGCSHGEDGSTPERDLVLMKRWTPATVPAVEGVCMRLHLEHVWVWTFNINLWEQWMKTQPGGYLTPRLTTLPALHRHSEQVLYLLDLLKITLRLYHQLT